ncbi:diguanylate cyclase [Sulfurimicrobium lacus]|uniref:diguanylate cyclase n=1 Tax=Sulfurimicrobium lacus TaxID=2715678 RepID=A0A6F8VE02_9PROT|nr:diguanylate cyclase [Sulfurimicrobium lacus]BCB27182.1 diguanylate cyclase [Sulfurimicrobium lacus]
MPTHLTEPGLPGILKKLGSMTAIRDTYLVEQSLLRTLGPLLGVLETSLYRVDDNGVVLRALHHARTMVTEEDGVQRVAERVEEIANDQNIPSAVRELLDNVRLLGKPCRRKTGNDLLICYPLRGGNELCGYFVFQRDREVTPVEDAIVNGVLEVFTNYYELLDTSQRDQLTGLLNRYSLETNLDRLWNLLSIRIHDSENENSRRDKTPKTYWLGVLDIDHFKSINDTYGHIMGDEVLILVTRLLQSSFRQSDLLYRYGGEEFIAIIAANDLESATLAFERARKKIEEFQFPQVGHVTISGGFSGADPRVLPQEVINRADSSLYAAKHAGRNRIFHYDTLVKEGVLKEVASGSIDLF